ncbi:MAG: DUF1343 domain-containing protein [Candidatus Kapabacteria bacterium]|nr:DUF1343 domain-containing protein [Candidatus Kapabacteria bacterium]
MINICFRLSSFISIGIFCLSFHLYAQSQFKFGIDVLQSNKFKELKHLSIALVTNTASTNRFGKKTVDIFIDQKICTVKTILTPEHGLFTLKVAGEKVNDTLYRGKSVVSLYGSLRRPTKKILEGCDAIVIDLQDIGIRSYTYISTMYMVLDAANEFEIPVFILDRPNPLGGDYVEGSVLDTAVKSFVGIAPIPYIHGMTIGELALMFSKERWLNILISNTKKNPIPITVIPMQNWKRTMTWEDTKVPWNPTSPNIPSVSAIRGCAITGIIGEMSVVNIGIGTEMPFQIVGSPTLNSKSIAKIVNNVVEPTIRLESIEYTPQKGLFANKVCKGVLLNISPNSKNLLQCFSGILLQVRTLDSVRFTQTFTKEKVVMLDKIMGKKNSLETIQKGGKELEIFLQEFRTTTPSFLSIRKKYLLYK